MLSLLRRERERRGWSRDYVAAKVEVDVATVGRWERGERIPQPYYRQKLCTLFEKNAQELGLLVDAFEEPDNREIVAGHSSAASNLNDEQLSQRLSAISFSPSPSLPSLNSEGGALLSDC